MQSWLKEPVCWDHSEYITRAAAIHRLCNYGLKPFLASYGYTVDVDIVSKIATGLYRNRGKTMVESNWSFGSVPNSSLHTEEYKNHYYHVLNPEVWDSFWNLWSLWSDIDTDRQNDIQEYCWSQLNLEESPQMQVVYDLMGMDEDAQNDERDMKDVYLKEAAESNEWGGMRR